MAKRGKGLRNIGANVLSILIVVGLAILVTIGYAKREFEAPGPLAQDVIVQLPKGADLKDTARLLKLYGAIDSETIFRLGARYQRDDRAIRYGEYQIPAQASMAEILAMMVAGQTVQHKVTVAEGLTSFQVVEILNATEVLTGEIPAVPAEGSLAPDTYFVQRGETREAVIKRMEESQQNRVAEAWAQKMPASPLRTPEELLVMASIVEKETGVPEERPRVASVFLNRLRQGMRLQSDPTVVYGITLGKGPLGRGLKRSELDKVTPYNTYQIDGLPPTPIAAPGREALLAVVNPEPTNFLYFVADGTGGHVFSASLAEHNANVQKWRQIEQGAGQGNGQPTTGN